MVENRLVHSKNLQSFWNSHWVCRKLWHQILAISEHNPLFRALVGTDLSVQLPPYCIMRMKAARPDLVATWGSVSYRRHDDSYSSQVGFCRRERALG